MKEIDKLSRRSALLVGLNLAIYGSLAFINRKLLEGFAISILEPLPEVATNYLAEIASRIQQGEAEGPWGKETKVNIPAFATALSLIAINENPNEGLQKLRNFLYTSPLTIKIMEENAITIDASSKQVIITAADYRSSLKGGPEIRYYPPFLAGYKRAQSSQDPEQILQHDKWLLHEVGHLWQDVENRFRFGFENSLRGILIDLENITSLPLYDYGKDEREEEANQIAEKVVTLNVLKPQPQNLPWPFGRFFEFDHLTS